MNDLSETQRRNCRKLADLLETIPGRQLDMNVWVLSPGQLRLMEGLMPEGTDWHGCGTVGCALGWAAMSGQFPGLSWCAVHRDYDGLRTGYVAGLQEALMDPDVTIEPAINGCESDWYGAAMIFFGLYTYHFVFTERYGSNAKRTVIRRLRALARGESLPNARGIEE